MSETPRLRLHRLLSELRTGHLPTDAFCAQFEHTYNIELDKSTLSPAEAVAFADLFDQVIWYSPFPGERAMIPNDRSEEDIARATEVAAQRLDKKGSEDLATLIVDALVDGGVVKKEDLQRAIEIVTEEIEVRKALGDVIES